MSGSTVAAPRRRPLRHYWPMAVGLAAAVGSILTAGDSGRDGLAITVSVAALCYLAAAALATPWVAWAAIPAGTLVVIAGELVGLTWWAGIGLAAVVLIGVGLGLRVPGRPLTAQALALAGFGGVAVLAMFLAPEVGLVVAGLALASHAFWDVIHLRRRAVVPTSMAEACLFLDVPLGLGLIVLTFVG